jgi:hypothetical protein
MAATTRMHALVVRRERPDGVPVVGLETLARQAGMHPDLVRRFIALGLLERGPVHPTSAAARLARAARLRRDLGLSYAGAVLACELLERIDELEARLRRYEVN